MPRSRLNAPPDSAVSVTTQRSHGGTASITPMRPDSWQAMSRPQMATGPAQLADETEAETDRKEPASAVALLGTLSHHHRVTARKRILVVEDDAVVTDLILNSLELEGEANWQIHTANEGTQALRFASMTPPDVILLDVRLPGMDGAAVYRTLRAGHLTQSSRILFLSAGNTFDLHQMGIEDGVLLRKPFDVRYLVQIVRALLAS